MRRKRLISLLFLTFFWLFPVSAQDLSGVKSQLNAMFSGLDKTKVPTGFLWDTAANLVEGEDYNGSALTDSNYVDLPRLYDMIYSINSASVGADTIPANRAIARIQNSSSGQSAIIGVLFKPYNYIVANALQDNLITYSNQVVSDKYINGIWQNPYGQAVLVGHAVGNEGVVYQSTSFTLQNVDSLSTQTFSSIQFDAGDGNGYRNVSFGTSFSVSYASNGYKETKLKLVTSGITYLSHSMVNVVSTPNNAPAASQNYQTDSVSVKYNGKTYYAKYSCVDSLSLNNPLIVAEGFDPWRIGGDNRIHRYSGFNDIKDIYNKPIFCGFDVVYIDWYDCGADIRANARLLEEVINWVNDKKTSDNPNVVLGQSMGGLIARYCLCSMEEREEPHETRLFISHDVPHRGVSVSPGLQYLYWDLRNIVNEDNELLLTIASALTGYLGLFSTFLDVGSYESVRQMLAVYLNSSEVYDNSVYLNFQTELSDMGFPNGDKGRPIENVAIVNGGGSAPGGVFSFYNPGDKQVHFYAQASSRFFVEAILAGLLNELGLVWIPGRSTVTYSYDVFPYLYNSTVARSMSLTFTKTLLWCLPITFVLKQKTGINPGSGVAYDAVSSSYYSPPGDIENNCSWSLGFPWNQLIGTFDYEFAFNERIQFVPTASALCSSGSYYQDFFMAPIIPKTDIPFDSYILNDTSTYHTSFALDGIDSWLNSVFSEAHVPPVVFDGDTLKVTGTTLPFKWYSSNSSVALIRRDSIVQCVSNGLVDFTARRSATGQAVTKTRKALVGYPTVTLHSQMNSNGSHVIQVMHSNREHERLVEEAVNQGILQYRWGIKTDADSPIAWRETINDTIHVTVPDSLEYVTVYMKWRHGNGYETTTRSLQVFQPNIYKVNVERIDYNPDSGFMAIIQNPALTYSFPGNPYNFPSLMFSALSTATIHEITSITIDNHTFQLTDVEYFPYQNGANTVVYMFDILFDTTFQDIIADYSFLQFGMRLLTVHLNDSNGSFQTVKIFCQRVSA